jgi:hypothetical protein
MPERLVICPNHGIIERIPVGMTWIGAGPPNPANYCPACGSRTVVEEPKHTGFGFIKTKSEEEVKKEKEEEIAFYRKKYWPDVK